MSEFKFSCPNCGQHLAADEGWSGAQIPCPKCQTPIVVPRLAVAVPVAVPAPKPVSAAPPVASPPPALSVAAPARPAAGSPQAPPPAAQAPVRKFSGLAIISLVLALVAFPLSGLAIFVGLPIGLLACIPAVVCGHLAVSKIARNRALKGAPLAWTGLGLGYLFALGGVVSFVLFAYVKQAMRDPRRQAAFAQLAQAQAVPGTNLVPSVPAAPPPLATAAPPAGNDPPVKTDPNKADIPAKPAAGTLYGQPFTLDKARFAGGVFELTQGKRSLPDAEMKMFLFLKPGESLDSQTIVVSPQSASRNPHVHLAQRQGTTSRGILTHNYALRLEFGKITGKRVPFKIYFEAPQSYETAVAGEGVATVQ